MWKVSFFMTVRAVNLQRDRVVPFWAIGALCGFAMMTRPACAVADPDLNALLPDDIRKSGVITIATDAHYPPCESLADDDKTMVGYEPELWTAIAEKLQVRLQVVSTDFGGLIPGVQSGRYQMAIECISDSAARENQVTFIDNAYATQAVYSLANNDLIGNDPLSLCGRKMAAQAGSDAMDTEAAISARCVKNGKAAVSVSQFPSAEAIFNALYAGRVDFVLDDAVAAAEIERRAPVPVKISTNDLMPRLYTGIVVLPEAKQLAGATLAALKSVEQDGTYAKIMEKWGLSPLALGEPGINLATAKPLPVPQP
jgi:polar amino acid transport system substrate-binding protein